MTTTLKNEINSSVKNPHDLFLVSDWLYWTCEYAKARKHFQYILEQPSLTNSDLARGYKSLAAVEIKLKNYDEALNIYNKQLDVLQAMCDSNSQNEDIMSCYISIGKVHWLRSDYNQAIAYHNRALEYAQSPNHYSAIYKNLANIFTNKKQFDQALQYFQKALLIDDEQHQKNYLQLGQTYANMAVMYQSKENYQETLNHFEKARETLLKAIPATHVVIKKIDKTIRKVTPDILARNNIMVLWLDDYIGRDENCRALKMEFRQITNNFKMFDSVPHFQECLPYIKDRKLFCIIQGKYAKEIVPDIVRIISPSMEPVVYIFCLHMKYLKEWAEEQECIMRGGMFDHEKDLLDGLKRDLNDYIKQKKSIDHENKLSPELVIKFLEKFMQISQRCYKEKLNDCSNQPSVVTAS